MQHSGIREKFCMCESPRAQKFLNVALHLQDEVYTRVADLKDEQSVFGADLFYYKFCLKFYLQKYTLGPQLPLKGPRNCQERGLCSKMRLML